MCEFLHILFICFLRRRERIFHFFRGRGKFLSPLLLVVVDGRIGIVTLHIYLCTLTSRWFFLSFKPVPACMHEWPRMWICICVSRLQSRHLKVNNVYSTIWGCVVLPLCSSQESPQQEGWCQGKLGHPLHFHLQHFLFIFMAVLPYFYYFY